MPTFLRIDETPTEEANDRIVEADETLKLHRGLLHTAFDLMPVLFRHVEYKNDDELAFTQLGIRSFNSACAALKLARSGYYQPSLSMVRDVIETQFLIDVLRDDQKELSKWVNLPPKEREKRFSPSTLRKKLDQRDGFKNQERTRAYKLFCEYAAHPTPNGFRIISPGGMTQVGAFPSKDALTACVEELAKHFPLVCQFYSSKIKSDDEEVLKAKGGFLTTYLAWKDHFYGPSTES